MLWINSFPIYVFAALYKSEKRLRRQHRKLSRKKKSSQSRKKQERLVALVHERTGNRRKDFLHKSSRYYVNKYVVKVIAKGTTQECSVCGKEVPKDLSERIHRCPYCGSVMPGDYNSSLNIKLRGLDINNPEQVLINDSK